MLLTPFATNCILVQMEAGLSGVRMSVERGGGRIGHPRPLRMSARRHAVHYSTRRSALADGMADGHPDRWLVTTSDGRDADGHSAQRLGWRSASRPPNRLPGCSLYTKLLQNHCKIKPSTSAVRRRTADLDVRPDDVFRT
jgi:hypothetical protein